MRLAPWALLALVLTQGCSEERAGRLGGGRRGASDSGPSVSSDASAGDAIASLDAAEGTDSGFFEDPDSGLFFDASFRRDSEIGDLSSSDGGDACVYTSAVLGRVCAPEQREWVPGATVTLEAIDCHGVPFTITATSGNDGSFRLDGVPPGTWTVTAQAGAFSQTYTVTVLPGREEIIPNDRLCVQQDVVRVAVVTGFGDRIENLLGNVGIQFDTYDGNSGWSTSAAPFLSDLSALQRYDLIFIDCAAATMMYTVDLGANAQRIIGNLRQYVMGGGSLYASDWAVTFLALAFPSMVEPQLRGTSTVAVPFDATRLSGYAPQTVNARVVEPSLARAIGATQVAITFPDTSGARSGNWGLLELGSTPATVLVEAEVATCSSGAMICNGQTQPGPMVTAPLGIKFKLTPVTQRGGNVFYTSFHNIAQTGTGVADILRWIIFHL
jgi:hypothetical protein